MIETAERLGARLVNGELLQAERLFRSLPIYIKEHLTCKCEIPYNAEATEQSPHGYRGYRIYTPSGTQVRDSNSFCTKCLRPHRFSVVSVVQICEECDKYYVPNPRQIRRARLNPDTKRVIDRYRLCSSCGG